MKRKRQYKPLKFLKRKAISPFKWLRIFLKHRLGWLDRPKIITYRSYGKSDKVEVWGGLVEDRGLAKPQGKASIGANILAMFKRFTSDQLPGVKVQVSYNGIVQTIESDEYGLIRSQFNSNGNSFSQEDLWHPVRFALAEEVGDFRGTFSEKGEVLMLPYDAEFGVVSDVDDTILVSHATQMVRKIQLMLLKNAHTRKPLPGAAAFYKALHEGKSGKKANPFFYVSSSEWNLYDLLDDFCHVNEFPKGVFLLKEFQSGLVNLIKAGGGNHDHKKDKITHLLDMYEDLPFILIGDSGQRDAYIYLEIVKEFPGRIKTTYIREVKHKKNTKKMQQLREEYKKHDVDFLVIEDTYQAALHALKKGYIDKSSLLPVLEATHGDKKAPGEIRSILEEQGIVDHQD